MKTTIFYFVLLFFGLSPIFAQNPLVGTWEYQEDTIRSVKIITPTHWMVFSETLIGSEAKFLRAQGGTYTIDGNKYIENIQVASWDDFGKEKTDFTFEIEGDKFHQKGNIILADGTNIPIDERWKKVETGNSYDNNPAIGTWDQLSSAYTLADGTHDSHTNATATRFQVITPTHWMRISHRNNKFENVMGGSYNTFGNTMYPTFDYVSSPDLRGMNVEIEQRVEGGKMYVKGFAKDINGNRTITFDDVFQLVNPVIEVSEKTVKE